MSEPVSFSLEGRVAVVTGASRGIGAAIAAALAAAGARTVALSRSGGAPEGVEGVVCDVGDDAALASAFAAIGAMEGCLDVLVNAAGISLPRADEGELERFRRTLAIDLVAPYCAILAALPLLERSGHASVINVTSINSVRGFPGNPGYVASKAGLAGLTRALAIDLAPRGVRVNALAPGYVATAMTEKSHADPALHAERSRHTALGRWGRPEDMAGAALFLASDASAYVTGQEIFVDGGWTIRGLAASAQGEERR